MKKLLILFLAAISITAESQSLDTLKIRPFALRAKDWGFVAGFVSEHINDTLYADFYDVLKAYNRANPNTTANTIVSFDSVPAKIILNAYKEWKQTWVDEVETNVNRLSVRVEAISNTLVVEEIARWREHILDIYNIRWRMGARYVRQ